LVIGGQCIQRRFTLRVGFTFVLHQGFKAKLAILFALLVTWTGNAQTVD
jgi:hypothetical protein